MISNMQGNIYDESSRMDMKYILQKHKSCDEIFYSVKVFKKYIQGVSTLHNKKNHLDLRPILKTKGDILVFIFFLGGGVNVISLIKIVISLKLLVL